VKKKVENDGERRREDSEVARSLSRDRTTSSVLTFFFVLSKKKTFEAEADRSLVHAF
jgi:hypothetical protein